MEGEQLKTAATITNNRKTATTTTTTQRRLLFDRRYGWVIDEWRPPAEEALAGGRGMFCVLPLAQKLIQTASLSVNMVTDSAAQILERRDQLSLQQFQATLGNQFQQFGASVSKPGISLLTIKDKLFLPANSSPQQHKEISNNLQEPETV